MKTHSTTAGKILLTILTVVPAGAQWINYPSPGTPRTPDGKPNLSAPTPKAPDGKADLSGVWGLDFASTDGVRAMALFLTSGGNFNLQIWRPGGAPIPMQPWTEALLKQRERNFGAGRPAEHCLPHGIPDAMATTNFKMIQHPGVTLILYEEFGKYRQVFTDGRGLPKDPNPAWFGYSIGKWDRDRFVVETAGFNDRTWLDDAGLSHTDELQTIERFHRKDFGHMDVEITFYDPKAFTQPWSITMGFHLLPDTDLIEDVCDNEKDRGHMVGRVAGDIQQGIQLSAELLSKYVGSYEFAIPGQKPGALIITMADGRLMLLGTELTPLSETEFAALGGNIHFTRDEHGAVTEMTLGDVVAPGGLKGVRRDTK